MTPSREFALAIETFADGSARLTVSRPRLGHARGGMEVCAVIDLDASAARAVGQRLTGEV